MPNYESIFRRMALGAAAFSIMAAGCGWRPAVLRSPPSASTSADPETPASAADLSVTSPPTTPPAPVVSAPRNSQSSPAGPLQDLEQLLLVTEVQQDQNRQPLVDGQGLVIHRTAAGWHRQDEEEESFRWVHDGLQRYFRTSPEDRPDLRLALESTDPGIAAAATIGLARMEGSPHLEALLRLIHPQRIESDQGVQRRTHEITIRRAAIETLAAMPGARVDDALNDLLEICQPVGDGKGNLQYSENFDAALHAELLDALARRMPAGQDPRFIMALHSPSEEVQATAVRSIVLDKHSPLPREVAGLITGGRSRLRITAIDACARRGDPATISHLLAAAYDPELGVRLAAIKAVGRVGGDPAIDALRRILRDSKTRLQEAAVLALADAGDFSTVFSAAHHKDSRVRRAAAEALAAVSDQQASHVAAQLLNDRSADVQARIVASLDQWPLERAGPLLLTACGSQLPTTRGVAFAALARRWPPAARRQDEFESAAAELRGQVQTIEAQRIAQDRRGELLTQLAQQWHAQFGTTADSQLASAGEAAPSESPGAHSYTDGAIAALRSTHIPERHAALVFLAERSRQSPPSEEVLRAVALATSHESDASNWLLLLEVAAISGSEMAPEVAYAALRQTVPEVKVAACRLLGDRPSPAHVPYLLPNLDVNTPSVTSAALEALGGCGPIDDTIPMELLLACSDPELRVDAAAALARLGVRSGSDALERLLIHRDSKVKVRAVHAIARLEDPLFLAALMDLLDRRIDSSVRRAVLAALPVVTAHDINDGIENEFNGIDNVVVGSIQWQEQRWRDWYYSGGSS